MECTVNKLARMSGVSTRTLRYYDEIGLLKPTRITSAGYRIYGCKQVDDLQQILFYKELDFALDEIKALIQVPEFDRGAAFADHLTRLNQKRERLDMLIGNVEKSIIAMKGEFIMADKEKFEGFKQKLIAENEEKYGVEIREKYGDEEVDEFNANFMGLTKEQFDEGERLQKEMEKELAAAFAAGDPAGEAAQKACDLHRQWLCVFYPKYSKAYHLGLAEMYVADDRFRENYDKIAPGCTEFLRDAIKVYCN